MVKESTIKKELEFIESLKNKEINGDDKKKYRTTHVWKELRKQFYIKDIKKLKNGKEKIIPNVDELTLRPLNKSYNLHHLSTDSKNYTTTNREDFALLSNQTHKMIHIIYSETCKDRDFLLRLVDFINKMGKINDWKDFK